VIESLELQQLAPADWRVLRSARLKALLDSPQAFTSTHDHEAGWCESEWRRLFDAATWIVARQAEELIGLARSVGDRTMRHVESVWVAPTHRRHGVCGTLLQGLAEIDRRLGVTDLLLWVLDDNVDAQHAYEALGFKRTGESQSNPIIGRIELRLRVCADQLMRDPLPWKRAEVSDSQLEPSTHASAQELLNEKNPVPLVEEHEKELNNAVPV
jgi:ribosomal protein S18 acetylase RimI-like enzyme